MKFKIFYIKFSILIIVIYSSCNKDKIVESEPVQTQTPFYVQPGEPGFISVDPSIIYLHKGTNARFNAKLYDSEGNLLNQPSFNWISYDPQVISVSGDGTVDALEVGFSQVEVTDDLHGIRIASVMVLDDTTAISTKPVSIQFDPPFVALEIGKTKNVNFTLTDGSGSLISGIPVHFFTTDNQGITMNSSGEVSATSLGSVKIQALIPTTGDTLSDYFIVYAYQPQSGGNGQCSDSDWVAESAFLLDAPSIFSKPGLVAKPIRIEVFESCQKSLLPSIRIRQISPTSIEFAQPNVASLNGDGLIVSNGSGFTGYRVKINDQVLDGGFIFVYPQLQGKWSVFSSTGDSGVVSINNWLSKIFYSNVLEYSSVAGTYPSIGAWAWGTGESCFWKGYEQCEGFAFAVSFISSYPNGNFSTGYLEPYPLGSFYYCWRSRHSPYDPTFFWNEQAMGLIMEGYSQPYLKNGIICVFRRNDNAVCEIRENNLTGTWLLNAGTGTCSYQGEMILQQDIQILSGSYWLNKISGPSACFTSISGSLSGEVNGNTISIGLATSGGDNYSFIGTIEPDGNHLVGTWTSSLLSGTWSATRN